MSKLRSLAALTLFLTVGTACSNPAPETEGVAPSEAQAGWNTLSGAPPVIIAHRGASGTLPEHTLEAYALAIDQGADFIEPDLVITQDGHLIARHDRYLSTTTNVSDISEFADRKTVKPGRSDADWYAEDFTLEEIKQLRARQPFAGRATEYDDQYQIPTLEEVLSLANQRSDELGRQIGIYPETKQPSALEALGLSFDQPLLQALQEAGYEGADAPVFIQSFEADILKRLNQQTETPLVFLIGRPTLMSFETISEFADGVGPYKLLLMTADGASTGFLESAHDQGLMVHTWTLRDDDVWAPFAGDPAAEISAFLDLGVDGLFTDFPETGVTVRDEFAGQVRP